MKGPSLKRFLRQRRCKHTNIEYWFTYYGDQRMYLGKNEGPHLWKCLDCDKTLYLFDKPTPEIDVEAFMRS